MTRKAPIIQPMQERRLQHERNSFVFFLVHASAQGRGWLPFNPWCLSFKRFFIVQLTSLVHVGIVLTR